MTGRVAIVTGANTGIGFEVAKYLCEGGNDVVMACRSLEKGQEAMKKIKSEHPNSLVQLMELDLSSLTSVRAFVQNFTKRKSRLNILVNNAGMALNFKDLTRRTTREGCEVTMATNHFDGEASTLGIDPGVDPTTPSISIPGTSEGTSSSTSPNTGTTWSKDETLLLIATYKAKNIPKMKRKDLYRKIAEVMKDMGYNYDLKQIENRWKTLLAAYRRHKDNQNQTGKGRKKFEFESEMDDILKENHDTNPTYVMGTMGVATRELASSTEQDIEATEEDSEEETDAPLPQPPKKKKKSQGQSSQVLGFLEKYTEQQKEKADEHSNRVQQMHNEKMEIFKNLIDVMKANK